MSSGSRPADRDRAQSGDGAHRGRRLVRPRHATLADAGPLDDPLVGRVDHPLEVGVGEDVRWGIRAPAREVGADRRHSALPADVVAS